MKASSNKKAELSINTCVYISAVFSKSFPKTLSILFQNTKFLDFWLPNNLIENPNLKFGHFLAEKKRLCFVTVALSWQQNNWSELKKWFCGLDFGKMNRYVQLEELGNGTYGSVLLGQRVDTGEKVKSLSFYSVMAQLLVLLIF